MTDLANLLLQQYLPFTVLKLDHLVMVHLERVVATVLTVHGIETPNSHSYPSSHILGCNSTYRSRY